MLVLKQFLPLQQPLTRLYAKKVITKMNSHNQIHKETLRIVNPCATINIFSEIPLTVRSADVIEYPNGDTIVAELHGDHVKNCTASMDVQVSDDEKHVDVKVCKLVDMSEFHCNLAVPLCADLFIEGKQNVSVSKMFGKEINVKTNASIKTKELKVDKIHLESQGGNINCKGLLLGQRTQISTTGKGNISMDKLQGDELSCKTVDGNISTQSCYSENSKFETDSGKLELKNVHKKTAVYVYKKGDVNMTGVHGNMYIRSNGGTIQVQVSELSGENIIMGDNIDDCIINISDGIEESAYIELTSSANIKLDDTLSHLSDCLKNEHKSFQMSTETDKHNKLLVHVKGEGGIHLGKLSWADNIRASMGIKNNT